MTKIFESPDKGESVYERDIGTVERTLIKDTRGGYGRSLHEAMMEDKLWGEIRNLARTNPTLQDALERAIVVYRLVKTNGD